MKKLISECLHKDLNQKCGIYKLTCNEHSYIGSSINIYYRLKKHISDLLKNKHANKYMQNAFNKYGKDSFMFEVIEECTIDLLNERERYWQEFYISVETGLNCLYTKTDTKRCYYGKDSFERRSLALKGVKKSKPVWNKGKTNVYTKETLDKMSKSKKGKTYKSKGVKKPQMSGENHPLYGVKRPEFSANQTGDKNPMYGKTAINAKEVINIITQEVFSSIREAAIFYNLKYSTLQQKINGTRKNNTNLKFKNHDN